MHISPYIYIGHGCNNSCLFCSESDEYLENLELKDFNQIKKEITKVRKNYDFISFMGREPTLRDDLFDILKFAVGLNFKQVSLTTNGRRFSYEGFAKEVLKTGVKQIGVSLLGSTSKTHDKLTQVSDSFNQTIKGISNIVKFKKPEVSLLINLPLNKLNYFELKEMLDLLSDLKVNEINVLFVAPLSKRSRDKKIIMKMSDLGKYVFKTINPYLNNSEIKFLMVEFLPCSLPKEAQKYFFPCLEKNPEKIRIPLCKKCSFMDQCDGVLKSYLNLYGDKEFKI